ncbi:hypothetical protein [Aporhodopirellula aestuarii]|uniref:Uncharacterized protein n=1 Tax=Aporhodopirellula aestuarii TaxID=2950107 RepID=A0ABT0U8H8_9BACT|nr:hypothetical protein [Aporhodopirellula aestuarii]MCM2373222.1 hypothetical protein [Aporhodopirellula aestuarii]
MTENPYSSPTAPSPPTSPDADDQNDRSIQTIARRTFLAWEKLRIAYVAILTLITVLLVGPAGFLNRRLLLLILEGAVFANFAYFAGPTIETYVKWLGYSRRWPRWVMFIGGTLIATILTIGVLATELFPDQN